MRRSSRKRRVNGSDHSDNTSMPYLPDVIIFDILVRVPARLLVSLKAVSKSWKNIISSREFSEANSKYWKSRAVISERDRLYGVNVPPVENIESMKKWIRGEIEGKQHSSRVRGHLSWCGWTFSKPPKGKNQIPEMKYRSPDGKLYTSLRRACKAQCGLF